VTRLVFDDRPRAAVVRPEDSAARADTAEIQEGMPGMIEEVEGLQEATRP
jgi:hypothetical protein